VWQPLTRLTRQARDNPSSIVVNFPGRRADNMGLHWYRVSQMELDVAYMMVGRWGSRKYLRPRPVRWCDESTIRGEDFDWLLPPYIGAC
jgi:hypothetical protein